MISPIKKFTVLFLVGAMLTGSLTLGISAFVNRADPNNNPQQIGLRDASGDYKVYGAGQSGQNLTNEVTDVFARQLVEANPEGPQQNQDGSVQLFFPTSTELFSYLTANPPSEDILTPPIDESRIRIMEDFDTNDISHYLSEVAQIQSNVNLDPVWQAGISTTTAYSETTADWASAVAKTLTAAQDKMYATRVPAPFLPLQKSLITFFSTAASYSNVIVQDPVAAMTLANSMDKIVADQSADAEQALKDIQANFSEIVSAMSQEDRSVLAKIFEIPTAYATAPVIDYVHIATTILEWLKEFWREYGEIIKSAALGAFKNVLVQRIGQAVIKWAEGAGVPGYVTNWAFLEVNAAYGAQVGAISREAAQACGNAATAGLYGDILSSALGAAGIAGRTVPTGEAFGCPPADSGFYRSGGYSSEFFMRSMSNNVFNDLLTIRDRSIRAAAIASQAAVNEALSGRGSLDVKKCDNGSGIDPSGLCSDGTRPQTVTPGSAKQELISKALSAAQDTITSANNQNMYSALAQALAQAIMNYALREGEGIFSRSGSSPPPFPGGGGGGGGSGEPFVELVADPTSIPAGSTSVLTWSSFGMTTCSMRPQGGETLSLWDVNGSITTPPLDSTTSWTITCTGPTGTITDTATISVGGGGGGGGSSIFTLTPEERAVFTPPSDWCAGEGYPPGSVECEWSGTEGGPLKHAWEAFNTGSLPETNGPYGQEQWYDPHGIGSQNHALLNIGMAALSWGLQGNVENYEIAAANSIRLLDLDKLQGHQRHESLGYGDFWTGGIAAMALAGLYPPAGSTSGPQLLAAAQEWWADHIAVLRSIRMPDGQVGIIGARQGSEEEGDKDLWYAMTSAVMLQLADPLPYNQLHPSIQSLVTADGQPKNANYPGMVAHWYRPRSVTYWLVLRALQTGAFAPVPAGHSMPALDMDVYRWTEAGRTYVATPATCGYPPARWEVSWAPGEVLKVELFASDFGGSPDQAGLVTAPDVPGPGGKGPHPAPDSLRIPASANHLFGPAGPATRCDY